jgi:hypothetical protein
MTGGRGRRRERPGYKRRRPRRRQLWKLTAFARRTWRGRPPVEQLGVASSDEPGEIVDALWSRRVHSSVTAVRGGIGSGASSRPRGITREQRPSYPVRPRWAPRLGDASRFLAKCWSGRRDSNPRPQPWHNYALVDNNALGRRNSAQILASSSCCAHVMGGQGM